jgi:hypothetical protein
MLPRSLLRRQVYRGCPCTCAGWAAHCSGTRNWQLCCAAHTFGNVTTCGSTCWIAPSRIVARFASRSARVRHKYTLNKPFGGRSRLSVSVGLLWWDAQSLIFMHSSTCQLNHAMQKLVNTWLGRTPGTLSCKHSTLSCACHLQCSARPQ